MIPYAFMGGSQSVSVRPRSFIIPALIILAAAALLLVIGQRWIFWQSNRATKKTNDAYVHANIVPLSTRISDTLRELNVNDYQTVRAGQLLAQLDDTDYQSELQQAESSLDAARAALNDNQVQKQVQKASIVSAQQQVEEAVKAEASAAANVATAQAETDQADEERHRQEALYTENATTRQKLEKAVAGSREAHAKLDGAESDRMKAAAAIQQARATVLEGERSLELLNSKDEDYRAEVREREAAVATAQVQLNYTRIYAPADGRVGQRKVFPGQLVSPGVEVISLVEGDTWIEANYQETQLAGMRVGDAADIHIDAMPSSSFRGHVLQISPTSGAAGSLLPPDNASGNFTKVVQRLPVKVSIDSGSISVSELQPGLSAEVYVHASGARR